MVRACAAGVLELSESELGFDTAGTSSRIHVAFKMGSWHHACPSRLFARAEWVRTYDYRERQTEPIEGHTRTICNVALSPNNHAAATHTDGVADRARFSWFIGRCVIISSP